MTIIDRLTYCTLPEGAKRYSANYYSLLKYVKRGELNAIDISKGSQRPVYKVKIDDLSDFLRNHPKIKSNVIGIKATVEPIKEIGTNVENVEYEQLIALRKQNVEYEQKLLALKQNMKELESKLLDLMIQFDELTK